MKTKRAVPTLRPLLLIGCGILASCATPTETDRQQVAFRSDTSLPGLVHRDVNQHRARLGLRELKRHSGLDRLAQKHAEFLRQNRGSFSLHGKNVSHHGSESRALVAIQRLEMISYAENVAWAESQPNDAAASRALVTLWRNSPDHRDSMQDKSWSHTGIGVVRDSDGSVFATQVFATKSLSHMAMRERFNQF
jgi:uncharacterized protein YkwD